MAKNNRKCHIFQAMSKKKPPKDELSIDRYIPRLSPIPDKHCITTSNDDSHIS